MIRTRLLFLIPVFLIGLASYAQRYHFKRYANEEGLSQSQVEDMIEDAYGHLWISTNGGGVNRFDGTRFEVFTRKDGLQNNSIRKIFADARNHLWFITLYEAGLSYFNGNSFSILDTSRGLPDNKVYDIASDSLGRTWASTPKGLCQVSASKGVLKIITSADGLHNDTITNFFKDSKGWLWCYSRGKPGLSVYNLRSFQPVITANGLPDQKIYGISEDHEGNLWLELASSVAKLSRKENSKLFQLDILDSKTHPYLGKVTRMLGGKDGVLYILTASGLLRYHNGIFHALDEKDGLPASIPNSLLPDGRGGVWFVYDRLGICTFENDDVNFYPVDNSFIDHPVRTVMKDSQGTLWLGTNGAGLIKYPSRAFTYFDNGSGLSSNIVFGIEQDKDGNMWFGTLGQGISVYDGKKFTYHNRKNGFPSESAWSIAQDTLENIWIGTSDGLVKYDGRRFHTYTTKDGLISDNVFVVFVDSKNHLWIGTDEAGYSHFNGKTFRSATKEEGFESSVLSFAEGTDGTMYMATDGQGLARYDSSGHHHFMDVKAGLSSNYLIWLTTGPAGKIWIATQDNGICSYDGSTFSHISTAQGLSHNAVMSLVFDRKGNLWAGTNFGLNKIEFNDYGSIKKIGTYHKLDGFVGIECNSGACYCDDKGQLWFGSTVLTRYDPAHDVQNPVPPKTHLTNIKLFFKDLDLSIYADSMRPLYNVPYSLTLPYDQNHLIFEFIGISLRIPEKIIYQYKLEGLDKDWSPYDSKTEARYPSIPPGTYTFMVMARNEDKVWNEAPVKVELTILPPFWQTWIFYIFCFLAGIALIYSIVLWRIRNLKNAKMQLEEKVHERTETITRQKNELQFAYNEIRDSIRYARKIQESILPPESVIKHLLPDAFIFYKPKDIVSGDFYWIEQKDDTVLLAAVDCTGHGVPGAFMSIMGHSKLNLVVSQMNGEIDVSSILNGLNAEVSNTLKKNTLEESAKDGMDITLCALNVKTRELQYAGAYNPLYLIRDGIFREIKGDKFPIGIFLGKQTLPFTNHRIPLQENDVFYLFSDGYVDQFGGPRNKKFMSARFKNLLMDIHERPMNEQREILEENLETWRGDAEQVDDILVMGVRV